MKKTSMFPSETFRESLKLLANRIGGSTTFDRNVRNSFSRFGMKGGRQWRRRFEMENFRKGPVRRRFLPRRKSRVDKSTPLPPAAVSCYGRKRFQPAVTGEPRRACAFSPRNGIQETRVTIQGWLRRNPYTAITDGYTCARL